MTRTLSQETFLSKNDKQNVNATSLICALKTCVAFLKKSQTCFLGHQNYTMGHFQTSN